MNLLNSNSTAVAVVAAEAAVVCSDTVAAGAAEEGTMSSEGTQA